MSEKCRSKDLSLDECTVFNCSINFCNVIKTTHSAVFIGPPCIQDCLILELNTQMTLIDSDVQSRLITSRICYRTC